MPPKTPLNLSGLLAVKASPVSPAPGERRGPGAAQELEDNIGGATVPLNFRVPPAFRRRFRVFAARNDLKLSDLLRLAFEEYEIRHR